MKPIFITFEGGEATGKSTILKKIKETLESRNIEIYTTREPGGTEQAEKIREFIMDNEFEPLTEVLLFNAARVEHCKLINEKLETMPVISDRYAMSTEVYQKVKGVETSNIINAEIAADIIEPDITFLFGSRDVDRQLELMTKRIEKRKETNKFDNYDIEFHKKVLETYNNVFDENKETENTKYIYIELFNKKGKPYSIQHIKNIVLEEIEKYGKDTI